MQCKKDTKSCQLNTYKNAMFCQTSSIITSSLIRNLWFVVLRKIGMRATKQEFFETSELVNENFGSYTNMVCCQVPQWR